MLLLRIKHRHINYSNIFCSMAVKAWENNSFKLSDLRRTKNFGHMLPTLCYSCTQIVYSSKEMPNHPSALTGTVSDAGESVML